MKTYRYHKHILWMKYLLPAILLLIAVALGVSMISSAGGNFGISAALTIVLILEAWVIWWFFGRLERVEVGLTEDGIDYRGKKGRIEMPFEAITEIKQPSIRYTGGWIKFRSATETIRLTVVLEGISEFVRDLKESLDRRQLSDKYDRAKLFRFYKTATYSDHSWARLYEHFSRLVLLLVVSIAIGGVVASLWDHDQGRSQFLLWISWPSAFGILNLAVILIAEVIVARHFAKATNEEAFTVPDRDRAFESKVFRRAMWVAAALTALLAMAFIA